MFVLIDFNIECFILTSNEVFPESNTNNSQIYVNVCHFILLAIYDKLVAE